MFTSRKVASQIKTKDCLKLLPDKGSWELPKNTLLLLIHRKDEDRRGKIVSDSQEPVFIPRP